jgi:hypothetical protein
MTFGRELVVLLTKPCMFGKFWYMRGGSVVVSTKNILYRFMEGQTHFDMSRGAKMSAWIHGSNGSWICIRQRRVASVQDADQMQT